jgi:Na+-transporting NADH:ubiquinone oxidoreductase subunit F
VAVLTILLGVAMFAVVILLLVFGLVLARRKLVASGDVKIDLGADAERSIETKAGSTLLASLADREIFVPSACGGKGTCGVCKVKVLEGGGDVLATELTHVTRGEVREGLRLSCQVKVRQDMKVEIPPEVLSVRRWVCRVRSNRNVATYIKELVLELPEGEEVPFRAGGYIQLEVPPYTVRYADYDIEDEFRDEWEGYGYFSLVSKSREKVSRAYSMANYPEEKGVIILNVRIATPPRDAMHAPPGIATSYMFNLRPGDEVTISGPFGDFFARDTDAEMCFIGGGAGMAPMRSHIFDQLLRLRTKRKLTFWYGARSLREAFYVEEFDRLADENENFTWQLALSEPKSEDNWTGPAGFIHQVVRDIYLKNHPAPEDVEYYICGPSLMNAAVTEMLLDLGVEPENIMYDSFG